MRVLVTGVAGQLGHDVVNELIFWYNNSIKTDGEVSLWQILKMQKIIQ